MNWLQKRITRSHEDLNTVYDVTHIKDVQECSSPYLYTQNSKYLDFATLSYLGLHTNLFFENTGTTEYGYSVPIARTRMKTSIEVSIEQLLSSIFCNYNATLFSSVHAAVLSLLPIIASGEFPLDNDKKSIHILLDESVHHSSKILYGVLSGICTVDIFPCENEDLLSKKLIQIHTQNKKAVIVCDSFGSMGGVFPVNNLIKIAEEYECYIIFDDAHATSVRGKNGCGYVLECMNYKKHDRVIIIASFHKGFGANGAATLLPKTNQVEYLQRYGSTYAFSGPLSIPELSRIHQCSLFHQDEEAINLLQKKLYHNLHLFDSANGIKISYRESILPYRILRVKNINEGLKLWKHFKENGIITICCSYPTVAKGQCILRISIHATHTKKHIDTFFKVYKSHLAGQED